MLGEDNPQAQLLLEALKVAKVQATVPPIQDRIKACKACLERARKPELSSRSRSSRGGCGRREAVAVIAVGGSGSSSCAVAQCGGASATDRRFGAGTRVVESFSASHSQGAARTVVRERSTLRQGGPTNSPRLRGIGRVDQRTELRSQECSRIRQCRDHHTDWNSVEPRHRTVVTRLERCCDGRAVKVIVDGVDDRRVRRQAKVGARWRSSSCPPFDVGEPSVRVHSVWVGPLQLMPVHRRQCEGFRQ